MSGPAQRAAARRQARGSASTRPPKSGGRTSRASSAAAATTGTSAVVKGRSTLTGRAAVMAAVLGLVVFTLAVPARELIAQRAEINALRAQNDAAQARVDDLSVRQERLQDPAYVTSLIRERLHYVLPGEVGYVVLDPSEAPAPATVAKGKAPAAWYSTLWTSVEQADGAGKPAGTTVITVRPNAPR